MAKCGRRTKACRKCGHRYTKDEYELWECPECGEARACEKDVDEEGMACRFHGGASLKGVEHPNWKDGKYSKYVPANLAEGYKRFRRDDDRVSVEEELDLARLILAEQFRGMGDGASGENWKEARKSYAKALNLSRRGKLEEFRDEMRNLGGILSRGDEAVAHAETALRTMDKIRKLVDTERQIRVDRQEYITRSFALIMFGKLLESIEKHVLPLDNGKQAVGAIAESVEGMVGSMVREPARPDEWGRR
jgi:predicted  nucleic acid-binding Zn-ribbon protein